MSSIYRKGRDGYYYYQTYVYNDDTKKRDKRIYHSLSTKDHASAQKKQKELDLRYKKEKNTKNYLTKIFYIFRSLKFILLQIFLVISALFYIFQRNVDRRPEVPNYNPKNKLDNESKFTTFDENLNDSIFLITKKEKKADSLNLINKNQIVEDKQPIIPLNYTVERVDRLSEVFKLVKIYVTINKNSSKDSYLVICRALTKEYSKFSNILICFYTNNMIGRELAKGNDSTISIEEQRKAWLAMFTYNSVEGEYFDENPTSYLGSY